MDLLKHLVTIIEGERVKATKIKKPYHVYFDPVSEKAKKHYGHMKRNKAVAGPFDTSKTAFHHAEKLLKTKFKNAQMDDFDVRHKDVTAKPKVNAEK